MQITVKESSSVTINQHSHNVSVEHTYTNTLQLLLFLRRSAPRPLYVLFSESEWRMIVLQNCKGRPKGSQIIEVLGRNSRPNCLITDVS